jgi:hypothetical protein
MERVETHKSGQEPSEVCLLPFNQKNISSNVDDREVAVRDDCVCVCVYSEAAHEKRHKKDTDNFLLSR